MIAARMLAAVLATCSAAMAQPGALDPSFGTFGVALAQTPYEFTAGGMAISPSDGTIVLIGQSPVPGRRYTETRWALTRFNSSGFLDASFGSGTGYVHHAISSPGASMPISVQGDGKIVASGGLGDFRVARFTTSGLLDTTFSGDGIIVDPTNRDSWTSRDTSPLPGGKVLTVGERAVSQGGGFLDWDVALCRYNANGTLDTSFGSGGIVIHRYSSEDDVAQYVAVMPDGRLVTLGMIVPRNGGPRSYWLTRYNANGSHDATFGNGGRVLYMPMAGGDYPQRIAVAPDGKIVATIQMSQGGQPIKDLAVARWNSDGSIDLGFGSGGLAWRQTTTNEGVWDVQVQPDGKVVVSGVTVPEATTGFVLAWRLNDDGAPDAGFGPLGDGLSQLVQVAGNLYHNPRGLVLDASDRIVIGGSVGNAAIPQRPFVLRFQGR